MQGDNLRKALDELGNLADAVADLPEKTKQPTERQLARFAKSGNEGRGRPTRYTKSLGTLICARIAAGETLEQIMQSEGMPDRTIVFDWLARERSFANSYARARSLQAEAIAEKGVTEAWRDLEPRDVPRARLRWDSARWLAAKLDPAKWGDRADISLSVADLDAQARATQQRQELIAALERLAVAAPLTIEADKPSD